MKGFGKLKPSSRKYSLPASAKHAQKDFEEFYNNKGNANFDRCIAFCCRNQQLLEKYAEIQGEGVKFASKLSAMGYCELFRLPMDGAGNMDIRDFRLFKEWIQVNVFNEYMKYWA